MTAWWVIALFALTLAAGVALYLRLRREIAQERAVSKRLRQVNRLQDEFLTGTSQELYKPAREIAGIAEALLDAAPTELPPDTRSNLEMIVDSSRRLGALAGNILDLSGLGQQVEQRKRTVDLRALTDVVLTLSRPLVGDKNVELVNEIEDGLPPAEADEDRLQQILYDLIGYALQITASGSVSVRAAVEDDHLVVRVTASGTGLDRGRLAWLDDASQSGEASGVLSFAFAITQQLVELQGGELWIEPDQGAAFLFTLPVSTARTPTPAGDGPRQEPELPSSALPAPSARILVVDDDPVSRLILANPLTAMGYRVTQAAGGEEALQRLDERKFDLVLLDVMMPKISGYEVCRRLREQFSVQELPVIFLTARTMVSDLVTGFTLGANEYLYKPIAKDELLARVKTHLDLVLIHRNLEHLVEERTVEIHQLMAQLKARNADLEQFTRSVSHDLKSPLVTVRGFLTHLENDAAAGDRERMAQDIRRIRTAAERMHRLVEDLLELSSVGVKTNPAREVDFGKLFRHAADLVAGQIAERQVDVDIAPDLPRVFGDKERLLAVAQNLLENAVKYMGGQEAPYVEVGTRRDGEESVFFVRDNGMGIEAEHHERIFGLFERLTKDKDGTGLGLALVKRIVEVHGGRIWVESEGLGRGSTFCFTLPQGSPTKARPLEV